MPTANDEVTIAAGHTVTFNLASARVAGVIVEANAILRFDPGQDVTLETDENVLILGKLEMRPEAPLSGNDGWRISVGSWRPYHLHTLRFVDVNEGAFVGGGMDPIASDVGLWVRGDGTLDIAGAPKTGWTRLAGAVSSGQTAITLQSAPTGWRVGDEIAIAPTQPPSAGNASWNGFDVRTIASINGASVTLNSGLSRPHPSVVDPFTRATYTAEVLNLSRNVRIVGTGNGSANPAQNGRAHINIRSATAQSVRNAELRLLGPRRTAGQYTDEVVGRYPIHFHHSGDGSRGSLVESVVVRQSGNRAFVPHASHGITLRETVAFDVWEDAYWWDPSSRSNTSNQSHDTLYDRAVAALVKDDPDFRGYGLASFNLNTGKNNRIINSVAVGNSGNASASGFLWPEDANLQSDNVWEFDGNLSHNNKTDGIFVWQNDGNHHVIENFVAYHNGSFGIDHGAYNNRYEYYDVSTFGNGAGSVLVHAAPWDTSRGKDGYNFRFENITATEPVRFTKHTGAYAFPVLFKDCAFSRIIVDDRYDGGSRPTRADFVSCTKPDGTSLEPGDIQLVSTLSGMLVRVQRPNRTAYQIDHNGTVTTIAAFYDTGSAPPPAPPPAPTASLTANPTTIQSGQSSTLTWSSTNAQSCTGTGFNTGNATSGSANVSPTQNTTYQVACTGAGSTATVSALVTIAQAPPPPEDPPAGEVYALWSTTATPNIAADQDRDAVELGAKFRSNVAGVVIGVRFYRAPGSQGPHVGHLWQSNGNLLATVTFPAGTDAGWQEARFSQPVPIVAGQLYIASYFTPRGYATNQRYFTNTLTSGPLTAPASGDVNGNGVYRYGSGGGFPTQTWRESNYWVTPLFRTNGN